LHDDASSNALSPQFPQLANLLELESGACQIGGMNEEIDFRRTWRQNWLGCLRDFADAELQRRMWLDPQNQNPHWSYIEFMCSYFDDTLYGKGYDWAIGERLVTKEEVDAVAALHHLLATHEAPGGDDYNNERVLNDPAWNQIVEEAKRATEKLALLLSDPAEKTILTRAPIS